MASHIYSKLPIGARTIRLVELLPGDGSDTVQCKLHEGALTTDRPYKALSYAWGKNEIASKTFILCNEQRLEISLNLWHALCRLRHLRTPIILWIDALSINQADDAERTHQVGMMREIYENSSEVIIWLGEEQRLGRFGELTGIYRNSERKLLQWNDDDRDSMMLQVYQQVFADRGSIKLFDGDDGTDMLGAFCLIRLLSAGSHSKDIPFFHHISWAGAVARALWSIMESPWVRATPHLE